jgi:phosphomevalonate kinase
VTRARFADERAAIASSAPGKLVISGEYAVLTGATALVIALNRRVRCRIEMGGENWRFQSTGYDAEARHSRDRLFEGPPPAPADPTHLAYWLVHSLADQGVTPAQFPRHLSVALDSTECFEAGRKLGLGSSAATCAALGAALGRLCGTGDVFPSVLWAHRRAQGEQGSGLDVAAAWHGGTLSYRRKSAAGGPEITPVELPPHLRLSYVCSGESAATAPRIAHFERWRNGGTPAALERLCQAADALAAALPSGEAFMAQLAAYVEALDEFDRATALDIFSAPHRLLHRLAARAGAIYKPCGAGGGDMGMAFALEAGRLADFSARARGAGFRFPVMEPDQDGIEINTRQQ